jgi:tetratricopeptide (TPR) repeat protein
LEKKVINILIIFACICSSVYVDAQSNIEFISDDGGRLSIPVDSVQNEKQKLVMRAKQLSFEGNSDKAADLFREAIKTDPKCDACYYELANILIFADKGDEAKTNAEIAYRLDPENTWYAMLYGHLCLHFKELDKAQALFRQTLRNHADRQEIWFNLATIYEEQGLFTEALGILDTMIIRFGENDDISYRLFNISMNLKHYDKAIAEVKKLANNYPNDPRFATLLADAYSEMGEDSLAVDAYNGAIVANDSFAPALLGKAEAFRKKGEFSKYFKSLQQYLANSAITPETKSEYLNLILKIPSFAEYFKSNIDTLFAILTVVHPVAMDLKFLQARYFVATQRLEPALSVFRQLTDMDGNNKEAWIGLLSLEYTMKMFAQLEQTAQQAINSDPRYSAFYMYMALSLIPQNKVKPAIAILEKSIAKANCDSVYTENALSILGDMYFSINKSKKAFTYYEKVLKNNPENAAVLNNYAYYLSLTKPKELDKAYQMSKKAIELESSNSTFLDTYAYILYLQEKYTEAKTIFRRALAFGGSESAVILEHYADTLNKLGDRITAEIYWSQALDRPDCLNSDEIKKKLKRN